MSQLFSKNSLTEELGELKVGEFRLPQSIAQTGKYLQNEDKPISLESVVVSYEQETCDSIDQLEDSNKHIGLLTQIITE